MYQSARIRSDLDHHIRMVIRDLILMEGRRVTMGAGSYEGLVNFANILADQLQGLDMVAGESLQAV